MTRRQNASVDGDMRAGDGAEDDVSLHSSEPRSLDGSDDGQDLNDFIAPDERDLDENAAVATLLAVSRFRVGSAATPGLKTFEDKVASIESRCRDALAHVIDRRRSARRVPLQQQAR